MAVAKIKVNKEQFEEAQRLIADAEQAFHTFFHLLLSAMDTNSCPDAKGMCKLLEAPASNLREGVRELMNASDLPGPDQVAVLRSGKLRMENA